MVKIPKGKHVRKATIANNPKRKRASMSEKYDKEVKKKAEKLDKTVYK